MQPLLKSLRGYQSTTHLLQKASWWIAKLNISRARWQEWFLWEGWLSERLAICWWLQGGATLGRSQGEGNQPWTEHFKASNYSWAVNVEKVWRRSGGRPPVILAWRGGYYLCTPGSIHSWETAFWFFGSTFHLSNLLGYVTEHLMRWHHLSWKLVQNKHQEVKLGFQSSPQQNREKHQSWSLITFRSLCRNC